VDLELSLVDCKILQLHMGHLLILLLKTQESGILQFAHDGIDS
jgi:hypothetical protein